MRAQRVYKAPGCGVRGVSREQSREERPPSCVMAARGASRTQRILTSEPHVPGRCILWLARPTRERCCEHGVVAAYGIAAVGGAPTAVGSWQPTRSPQPMGLWQPMDPPLPMRPPRHMAAPRTTRSPQPLPCVALQSIRGRWCRQDDTPPCGVGARCMRTQPRLLATRPQRTTKGQAKAMMPTHRERGLGVLGWCVGLLLVVRLDRTSMPLVTAEIPRRASAHESPAHIGEEMPSPPPRL